MRVFNSLSYTNIRNLSLTASVILHVLLLIIFFFITYTINYPPKEYVELSFGTTGGPGSSGAAGTTITDIQQTSKPELQSTTTQTQNEVKEVELPKAKNTSEENVIKPADKTKQKSNEMRTENKQESTSENNVTGQGNLGEGTGSFGFDIDWGGKGKRKIYSYALPEYPQGVYKEIDIKLRFTILPDGTIGTINLLTKADTRLENAAINSLRNWRFEALSPAQKQMEQTAVIVFPYRLQ